MPYVAKINLLSYTGTTRKVYFSKEMAKAAKLTTGSIYTFSVGYWKCQVKVGTHKRSSNLVLVPQTIYSVLGRYNKTLHIRITKDEISLGPWIGVYAFQNKQKPPFGPLNPLLRDMFSIASSMGLPLYVLCPGEMTKSNGKNTVYGWEYTGRQWVQSEFPLPTFLLSKIVITPPNYRVQIAEELRRLEERGCEFLSKNIGNKWVLYNEMAASQELRKYLPQTDLLKNAQKVREFINRYGGVYIKPTKGTQGLGVYRLIPDRQKSWKLSFRKNYKEVSIRIPFSKQSNWIKKLTQRGGGFLLQQQISLLRDDQDRFTDFRWLLQKNQEGKWGITSRIARTSPPRATTTNLSTGGQVAQASSCLLQRLDSDRTTALLNQMDQVCITCAEHLERCFGRMGELGVDIAVDTQYQIWILEVNPRPGRKMLKIVSEAERLLSLRRPLEYARYATGFPL